MSRSPQFEWTNLRLREPSKPPPVHARQGWNESETVVALCGNQFFYAQYVRIGTIAGWVTTGTQWRLHDVRGWFPIPS